VTTRTLFVPCRRGSQRVPDKNTRPFAGHPGGLLGVKLDQLEATRGLDTIVVDSNDPLVLERARARQRTWGRGAGAAALEVHERPDHLGRSDTTTDDLIAYALATVGGDELVWTHVTSPFCGAASYERMLGAWRDTPRDRYDSFMAVHPIKSFVWSAEGPLNHTRGGPDGGLRWPRTQDVTPVYDVCSALFVVPLPVGRALGDRIGRAPRLFELDRLEALDIDWDEDFRVAEALWPTFAPPR